MKTIIYQQVHKKCSGRIAVGKLNNTILMMCDKCNEIFRYNVELPIHKKWRNVNKKDSVTIKLTK